MKKTAISILVLGMVVGCAGPGYGSAWQPVVDVRPAQQSQYPMDLATCQQYANQVMDAQQGAMAGAIGGAIFGALLGAAVGNRYTARRTAGVGALAGGVSAAAEAEGGQRGIIRRCLIGRGYSVLN